ncbi:MAG: methyltransferase domain-containing protein [Anaerolineae bacterium]|nr:methyltransferase domain-containing protein [Anaerolineae bacterium]
MVWARDVMAAYDSKYTQEAFRNGDSYYRLVLDTLAPLAGQSLLDIACGMGDTLHQAAARQLVCYGVDLSPVAVEIARQRVPSASAMVGNAQQLPFDDCTFDNVTLVGSLEHLLDPGECLLEIRRVLKWGGRALVLVPNGYYLQDILWLVLRKGHGPDHKQIVERFATAQQWRLFIESGGLRVERMRRWNFQWPRSPGDWAWYRANRRRWLGLLLAPFIPFYLSHSFLYLCIKDPQTRGRVYSPPAWPAPPKFATLAHTVGS